MSQGYILGPILFLININDIIYTSDKADLTLFYSQGQKSCHASYQTLPRNI